MQQTYNSLQLIKVLYGESFITDVFEVEDAIANNDLLAEEYKLLSHSKRMLPMVSFKPSNVLIQSLVEYSKTTH